MQSSSTSTNRLPLCRDLRYQGSQIRKIRVRRFLKVTLYSHRVRVSFSLSRQCIEGAADCEVAFDRDGEHCVC